MKGIGNTPLAELKNTEEKYGLTARIFAKLEKETEWLWQSLRTPRKEGS